MSEEQEKYTRPIKNLGYTISYEFNKDMYSANIHFPWNKKNNIFYHQNTLENFYKNLYEHFKNNN